MFFRLLLIALCLACVPVFAADSAAANPRVVLDTSEGKITIELLNKESPLSVANFIEYVKSGFYNGTVFHRVIPNFMIQGGGFTTDLAQKETRGTLKNEANNGLRNLRGTVAMARRGEPDSATAQFFINLSENNFLDHQNETNAGWGYAVFARVTEGMEIVDKIAATTTTTVGPLSDVPAQAIVIKSAQLLDAQK
jgi:cyclophilin family peptidyl-prolyl cis-trans isomerase